MLFTFKVEKLCFNDLNCRVLKSKTPSRHVIVFIPYKYENQAWNDRQSKISTVNSIQFQNNIVPLHWGASSRKFWKKLKDILDVT